VRGLIRVLRNIMEREPRAWEAERATLEWHSIAKGKVKGSRRAIELPGTQPSSLWACSSAGPVSSREPTYNQAESHLRACAGPRRANLVGQTRRWYTPHSKDDQSL
jgi:hypothetical protein